MSGLETAIRTALGNADRDNPEVRAKIYQSARQALEVGLRKQDITDPQTVSVHRHRLEAVIHKIEAEEKERLSPPPAQTGVPVPPEAAMPEPAPQAVPYHDDVFPEGETRGGSFATGRRDDVRLDDVSAGQNDHLDMSPVAERQSTTSGASPADFRPERAAVRRKPRKFFSRLLLWCLILAFIGIGVWWVHTSGLLLSPAERDTSVANPPASIASEDYNGDNQTAGAPASAVIDPQNGFSQDWIEVFKPADEAKLIKGSALQAQIVNEAEGPAVRLISQDPGKDGSVGIQVPVDVLQKLQGKSSTIAVTLQATTDKPTQITIECNFQSLGDCARHRFQVTRQKQDVLLKVRFERALTPSAAGTLSINSDVDGQRNGIDLYAVRILPDQ